MTASHGRPTSPLDAWTCQVIVFAIRVYRVALSPWLGPACRFDPSCSAYAIEAIERRGAARGAWLAAKRIGRCHPLGGFGYDPVP